ncbi:hypothetical protein LMG19083_02179 [Ralstonia psammae]|uniref:Uncharacterized protein n=1 Tax=Ralstonia psammae TaxID=3058598 RepID=A0ABM9JFH9_9RALS|nr:hypothetical protein LMG19083_02179 [Ralstonia sp. LMG 19083]
MDVSPLGHRRPFRRDSFLLAWHSARGYYWGNNARSLPAEAGIAIAAELLPQEANLDMCITCLRVDAYSRNIAMAATPMIAVAVPLRTFRDGP